MQKYDAVDFFKSAMDREEEWWKDYIYSGRALYTVIGYKRTEPKTVVSCFEDSSLLLASARQRFVTLGFLWR